MMTRSWQVSLVAFCSCWSLAAATNAAEEVDKKIAKPRQFKSADGRFELQVEAEERVIERGSGLRIGPSGRPERFSTSKVAWIGKARLVKRGKEGNTTERWSATLYDLPREVLISPDGEHVMTYDTLDPRRGGHELVIYNERGELLSGYQLDEVLSKEAIAEHVKPDNPELRWDKAAKIELDSEKDQAVVGFPWGKVLRFSLSDGKLIDEDEPPSE